MMASGKTMLDGRNRISARQSFLWAGWPKGIPPSNLYVARDEKTHHLPPTKFVRRYTPKCKWTLRAEARRREGDKALAEGWLDRNICGATTLADTGGSAGA